MYFVSAMKPQSMHHALEPVAWLEGVWRTDNAAVGKFPTINSFSYFEEINFSSIGQPMLNYTAQSWHPERKTPMHREVGFLKIVPNTNQVTFTLAHNFGLATIEEGEAKKNEIQLRSTSVSRKLEGSKAPAVLQV